MLFCGLIIVGAPIALFIYCMASFNREFTEGEGYLIMTLPISSKDFILSKFTGQLIWNILSVGIVMITFPMIFNRYKSYMDIIYSQQAIHNILNGITSYVLTVFIIYFSIAILSTQPRNSRMTFAKIILAMVATNIVRMFVGIISVLIVGIPFAIKEGIYIDMTYLMEFANHMQTHIKDLNTVSLIINILLAGIFYLLTKHIIEKKVQL